MGRSLKELPKNLKVLCNLQHQSRAPFTNNAKEGLLKPFRLEQVLYGTICNKLKNQTSLSVKNHTNTEHSDTAITTQLSY